MVSILGSQSEGWWFKPHMGTFFYFLNFCTFRLAITFFSALERSTNFHILIYMSMGSYHININFGLSWHLCLNLCSKITKFSLKYFTFLPIKLDIVIPATFQWYHSGPLSSADIRMSQTKKNCLLL